jgi:protease-4
MSMSAEQIIDRRRIRRKLAFWRITGVAALVAAAIGLIVSAVGRDGFPSLVEDQIARISISGFIRDNRERDEMIARLGRTDAVKAVIVAINSTGGSTAGGEALYESLKELAEKKPTVATIGTFGASAAYMAALATDQIVARRSSITGSIGVLFQFPNVSELLDNLGISVNEVKSSPLKASPSPFRPVDERSRAVIAGVVSNTYQWFVDIVAEERGMKRSDALALSDGRIYTGSQARDADLIDQIGGQDAAVSWLETDREIEADLPVNDWRPEEIGNSGIPFTKAALFWLAEKAGFGPGLIGGTILGRVLPESLELDGLLSVWQGSGGDSLEVTGGEQ